MMILIAAAVAAAAPAMPANPPADAHHQQMDHMQMGQNAMAEHKDGCPCCKDMADKNGAHDAAEHAEHGAH